MLWPYGKNTLHRVCRDYFHELEEERFWRDKEINKENLMEFFQHIEKSHMYTYLIQYMEYIIEEKAYDVIYDVWTANECFYPRYNEWKEL